MTYRKVIATHQDYSSGGVKAKLTCGHAVAGLEIRVGGVFDCPHCDMDTHPKGADPVLNPLAGSQTAGDGTGPTAPAIVDDKKGGNPPDHGGSVIIRRDDGGMVDEIVSTGRDAMVHLERLSSGALCLLIYTPNERHQISIRSARTIAVSLVERDLQNGYNSHKTGEILDASREQNQTDRK